MAETAANRRSRFEAEALPCMPALYRTAVHLSRNSSDAKDLVQDAYLRAYRAFDQFTPGTNCKAWMFTIMQSIFNSAYRKVRREQDGMQSLAREIEVQVAGGADEGAADPLAADSHTVTDPEVSRALQTLPDEFRLVVLLVDIGECSYEEAAAALQCPAGTVRSRLFRGRKLLAAALSAYARELGYAVAPEQA